MTRRAFRVRYNRNDPGGQWQAMMLQAQEGVWGEVPRMRSRIALALAGAALVASAALPVGAAADTPQYAGTFTGWKCLVQAPVLNCDLQISGGDAWDDFPLADFAGMSVSALQAPNNVGVLKTLTNIRQFSNFPGGVGPIAPGSIILKFAMCHKQLRIVTRRGRYRKGYVAVSSQTPGSS